MPKKVNRRPDRNRPRPRPVRSTTSQSIVADNAPAAEPVVTESGAPTPRPSAARPAAAATRRTQTRRVTPTVINYDYLRHDIRTLAVLAPSMMILVIIASFVFR